MANNKFCVKTSDVNINPPKEEILSVDYLNSIVSVLYGFAWLSARPWSGVWPPRSSYRDAFQESAWSRQAVRHCQWSLVLRECFYRENAMRIGSRYPVMTIRPINRAEEYVYAIYLRLSGDNSSVRIDWVDGVHLNAHLRASDNHRCAPTYIGWKRCEIEPPTANASYGIQPNRNN